jgi:hypothetical protein
VANPTARARLRLASPLLALAATVPLLVAVPAATAAAPAAVAPAAATPDIDALRARAEQASSELERRTTAWKEGRRALETAQRRLANVSEQATEARDDAEVARADLGAYAAAAYRNGSIPDELTVLLSEQNDPAETLHALATAEVAGRGKTDIVRETAVLTNTADQLEAEAEALAEDAKADDERLSADLDDIKATAARTANELQTALAEVARIEEEAAARREAERAARDAQRSLSAGGSGGGGGSCSTNATAGYPNGLIPASALCRTSGGFLLRADAAKAYDRLAAAYRGHFGSPPCASGGYRDLATQQQLFQSRPGLAAVPGTSNHGWGLAVDFCGGLQSFSSPQYRWMSANAGRFGWRNPSWARPGGGREEPWHWEYGT